MDGVRKMDGWMDDNRVKKKKLLQALLCLSSQVAFGALTVGHF